MGKIIALTNQKGGVGKTTSTINIGAGLARKGKKVLLVDLDPQANLTRGLGKGDSQFNIYGALLKEYPLKAYPINDNLALLAGSTAFSSFEKRMADEVAREKLVKKLLTPLKDQFDYILLDCPPSLGLITLNAYTCADALYIPLEAQLFAADGLDKVIDLATRIKEEVNPSLEVAGIFFTRFDIRKVLRRDTLNLIKDKYPDLVMNTSIRENIALSESPHAGQDIFSYAPKSSGAEDYQSLINEITASY